MMVSLMRVKPVVAVTCDLCKHQIPTTEYAYMEEYDHTYLKAVICEECNTKIQETQELLREDIHA